MTRIPLFLLFVLLIYILYDFLTTKWITSYGNGTRRKLLAKPAVLLMPLTSFLLGICLEKQWQFSIIPTQIFMLTALILTPLFIRHKNQKYKPYHIVILFFSAGMFVLAYQQNRQQHLQQALPQKKTTIIGRVIEKNRRADGQYDREVLRLRLAPPHKGDILWYKRTTPRRTWYKKKTIPLMPGDRIHIKNASLIIPTNTTSISANPPYADYLLKENVQASLFTRSRTFHIEHRPKISFARYRHKKRQELFEALQAKMAPKTFAYFSSIFLGNRSNREMQTAKSNFYYWGLAHYLARSGLHIALFIFLWILIFSLVPLPFLLKHGLLILLSLLYTLMSWPSISFFRALTLFFLYEIGIFCNRQVNIFYLLLLTTLTLLFFNPTQLFFLDFQLSFGLALALTAVSSK